MHQSVLMFPYACHSCLEATKPERMHFLAAAILVCTGLLNTAAVFILGYINYISVFWHVIGTVTLIILIPSVAPTRQSGSYVFTEFFKWDSAEITNGITNNGYLFLIGMLMSQFTITGMSFKPLSPPWQSGPGCLFLTLHMPQSLAYPAQQ